MQLLVHNYFYCVSVDQYKVLFNHFGFVLDSDWIYLARLQSLIEAADKLTRRFVVPPPGSFIYFKFYCCIQQKNVACKI